MRSQALRNQCSQMPFGLAQLTNIGKDGQWEEVQEVNLVGKDLQ